MTPDRLDWLKANKAIRARAFKKGCAVRGAPGRDSQDWTGVIVGNQPFKDGRDYWQVRWYDREFSDGRSGMHKQPVIGNTSEQIQLLEK